MSSISNMKTLVLLAIGVLGLVFLSSCSQSNRSVQTRLESAIQYNTERLASTKNQIQSQWISDILSALKAVNIKFIEHPQLASAVLVGRTNGSYGLLVFWIEKYPSVDGVAFRFNKESPHPVMLSISETELKRMRAQAIDTVVFGNENDWQQPSEVCRSLDEITNTQNLQIRLLRTNVPVTDWFPVRFYKLGKWISNDSNPSR
jgi:hypothetical protein